MEYSIDDLLGEDHLRLQGIFHTLREKIGAGGNGAKAVVKQFADSLPFEPLRGRGRRAKRRGPFVPE